MKFNSIQGRLQIWYGSILIALLAGFGFTTYQFERHRETEQIHEQLHERMSVVLDYFAHSHHPEPEFGQRAAPSPLAIFNRTNDGVFYYRILSRNEQELEHSANAPMQLLDLMADGFQSFSNRIELTRVMPPGERLIVGCAASPQTAVLHQLAWLTVKLAAVILVLGLAGGWWTTRRALQPIAEMGHAAGRISAGDLSQRINLEEQENELGRLAAILNATFARLEEAFAQQGQFTADAAHELRTPVTVILMQSQLALKRERTAAEYQETIAACQRAAQRMKRLLETLLELARWDAGEEKLNREEIELAEMLQNCVQLVAPLAEAKGQTLELQLSPLKLSGDPIRLAQVATNLLTNAIQYTPVGGVIEVSAIKMEDWAQITVADNGPGIAPEHSAHVFERFYRADKSRSAAEGHTGLGLAIAKTIVQAHNGTLSVASTVGRGTDFVVKLPL